MDIILDEIDTYYQTLDSNIKDFQYEESKRVINILGGDAFIVHLNSIIKDSIEKRDIIKLNSVDYKIISSIILNLRIIKFSELDFAIKNVSLLKYHITIPHSIIENINIKCLETLICPIKYADFLYIPCFWPGHMYDIYKWIRVKKQPEFITDIEIIFKRK